MLTAGLPSSTLAPVSTLQPKIGSQHARPPESPGGRRQIRVVLRRCRTRRAGDASCGYGRLPTLRDRELPGPDERGRAPPPTGMHARSRTARALAGLGCRRAETRSGRTRIPQSGKPSESSSREARTALGSPAVQDRATRASPHARTKTMPTLPTSVIRLECSFGHRTTVPQRLVRWTSAAIGREMAGDRARCRGSIDDPRFCTSTTSLQTGQGSGRGSP
jgi:hypothetical protein